MKQKETVLFKEGVAHVASMLWLQGGEAIRAIIGRLETAVESAERPPEFRRGVVAACDLVRSRLPVASKPEKIE